MFNVFIFCFMPLNFKFGNFYQYILIFKILKNAPLFNLVTKLPYFLGLT